MSAAATFPAIDANCDGVLDKQEFAGAAVMATAAEREEEEEAGSRLVGDEDVVVVNDEPVVMEQSIALEDAAAVTTRHPAVVTYVQPSYVYSAPQTYVYNPLPAPAAALEHPLITLTAGMRVVYTSRSNSQKYAGTVLQRVPTGYLLKLDVDGGLKEIEDVEVWRLEYEAAPEYEAEDLATSKENHQEKETVHQPLKDKKAKKSSKKGKKGCC
eukprot:TRINITY_DN123838_c0_g1_i1.p1 TRINITY_DN123838_c0_g1~~TRINITY_DN123838_c0_g1_i1.p1  ORF type:complete len:213 (-),score=66.26 TRINITY_DN123838_c0_g1_i1:254-892(-)